MSVSSEPAILDVLSPTSNLSSGETFPSSESPAKLDLNTEDTDSEKHQILLPFTNFKLFAEKDDSEYVSELKVTVSSPKKHVEPFETYLTFKITTECSRSDYPQNVYEVSRRYNEFLWLRSRLVELYPTRLIPPLPSKHSMIENLDRYAREFVLLRMVMLHRFLNRIVKHPILSFCPDLQIFLTSNLTEFTCHMKNTGSNLFSRMSTMLMSTTKEKYPEFEEHKKYLSCLTEKLEMFDKIMGRICKERKDLVKHMKHSSTGLEKWSNLEVNELAPVLAAAANAIHSISVAQENLLVIQLDSTVFQPIKEYLLYIESVNEALARRDMIHSQYSASADELQRKKMEKEQNGNSDYLKAEDEETPKLVSIAEDNHDKLQIANEDIRSDIERWSVEKEHDIKCIISSLSNFYIEYYQECLNTWEEVMKTISVAKK